MQGEVIDQGDGERAKIEMSVEPTLDGGWGLHLVDQVATRWGVREGSTHVWFEIGPAPPPPKPKGSALRYLIARISRHE